MNDTGWRFDKHISIGHILTTASVVVIALFWLTNIDKRVDLNTQAINTNSQRIERGEARQNEQFNTILNRLDSLDAFLRNRP